MGVKSFLGVIFSIDFKPALINPECSATPTPNIATKTIPKGAKLVKVVTIFDKKLAIDSAESKFFTTIASLVLGSISEKVKLENSADNIQIIIINPKNNKAGSGNLLPARSTKSRIL